MKGDNDDMHNDIIKFLDIKDAGIKMVSIKETATTKTITLEKELACNYCDACGSRMYSKGIYTRTVNHPILQDGHKLILKIKQRRWICSNPLCKETAVDEFSFVDKYRRNTNLSDILIVEAFKNPLISAAEIGKRFNVSDSHAIQTFARYVDMPRRQLSEAISIDEVDLDFSKYCKYALVIQDFLNGEPIDLVRSRREQVTFPYFLDIPLNERRKVKYIISDMYKPYLGYKDKYFPNATSVVDAFHVIQAINREYLNYIRKVIRRLDAEDKERHEQLEQEFGRELPFNHSKDYKLLKTYNWMLLKNSQNLQTYSQPRFNKRLGRMMTTYDYFEWFDKIDSSFLPRYEEKEKYIAFNLKYAGDPKGASKALPLIIDEYRNSRHKMFRDIAQMLEYYFDPIINSFVMVQKYNGTTTRLSNGPMEALNRLSKDMKRAGRGYRNFEYLRNRFLYAHRKNAAILGTPKKLSETYLAFNPGRTPEEDFFDTFDEEYDDDF